jgi:hypothetical protein
MSTFSGGVNFYPFSAGKNWVGEWVTWQYANGPLTVFANGQQTTANPPNLPVQSIWVPVINSPITVTDNSGTNPPYTTQSSGEEVIPIDAGQFSVTLSAPATVGSVQIYVSSQQFNPFRLGPTASQVTAVTATSPIVSSGGTTPNISMTTPLPLVDGGTGSTAPAGVIAGSGVTVTGSFPSQTVSATVGSVGSVSASSPLQSSGGTNPNISIAIPIPFVDGGTGTASPGAVAGNGINISGTPFQSSGANAWTISNIGVTTIDNQGGAVTTNATGGIQISGSGGVLAVNTTALPWTIASGSSGIINIVQSGPHNQTYTFDIATHNQFLQNQFIGPALFIQGSGTIGTSATPIGGTWPFIATPVVIATPINAASGITVSVVAGSITTSGASLIASSSTSVNWLVYGQA